MSFFARALKAISAFIEKQLAQFFMAVDTAGQQSSPKSIEMRACDHTGYVPKHYPNGNMADAHAEVGTLQQAYERGLTKGEDMKITLNPGKVCDYCFSDMVAMAKACELRSLTIHEALTGDMFYWEEGMKKFSVSAME